MASVFLKIVRGEIPSYKIAENDEFYAFLDINPLAIGHTLVIPKVEIDYIFDIGDDLYMRFFQFSKIIAVAIEKVVTCKRMGIAVVGLEVPHAHIHLIPLNDIYDIDFSKPKLQLTSEEFVKLADEIKAAIDQ